MKLEDIFNDDEFGLLDESATGYHKDISEEDFQTLINSDEFKKDCEAMGEEYKATIEFMTPVQANEFAVTYSRKTLRGHTVEQNKVHIYDITEDEKSWIDNYIKELNQ